MPYIEELLHNKDFISQLMLEWEQVPEAYRHFLPYFEQMLQLFIEASNPESLLSESSIELGMVARMLYGYRLGIKLINILVKLEENYSFTSATTTFDLLKQIHGTDKARDYRAEDLVTLSKAISSMVLFMSKESPEIVMTMATSSIIKHDVTKHIIPLIINPGMTLSAYVTHGERLLNRDPSSYALTPVSNVIGGMIQFLNYFSALVYLQSGLKISLEQLLVTMPHHSIFCDYDAEINISAEAYAPLRTLMLNTSQYLHTHTELEQEAGLRINSDLSTSQAKDLLAKPSEQTTYSKVIIANESSDRLFCVYSVANVIANADIERLKKSFEEYLANRGDLTNPSDGLRLALGMVTAGADLVGKRQVFGICLTIAKHPRIADQSIVEVRLMCAQPIDN